MRCYNINCFYLSGIHAGIQSGHAQKELSLKYLVKDNHRQGPQAKAILVEYLEFHKTVIVLNGGMVGDLLKVEEFLAQEGNTDYAWASFRESEFALNGTLTNIALILPWHIYAYKNEVCGLLEEEYSASTKIIDIAPGQSLLRRGDVLKLHCQVDHDHGKAGVIEYTPFDLELIKLIAPLPLMK